MQSSKRTRTRNFEQRRNLLIERMYNIFISYGNTLVHFNIFSITFRCIGTGKYRRGLLLGRGTSYEHFQYEISPLVRHNTTRGAGKWFKKSNSTPSVLGRTNTTFKKSGLSLDASIFFQRHYCIMWLLYDN